MLLLLHKTLKGSQNTQGFALIRAVLCSFEMLFLYFCFFLVKRNACLIEIEDGM